MGLFSKSSGNDSPEIVIDCGNSLDISVAGEFHQKLKSALGQGGEVVLEASDLSRVDAASLQLLTALFRDAAARKVTTKWRSPSESLVKAASLLGLSGQLSLP